MAGLLIWLEFGCMIPRSGGEKVYLEASYPRPRHFITIVFAIQTILLGFSGKEKAEWVNKVVVLTSCSWWMHFIRSQYGSCSRH